MIPRTDIAVVGGAGHVGLPLSLAFAATGAGVLIVDKNQSACEHVLSGKMPFVERGALPFLRQALAQGRLRATSSAADVAGAAVVIVTIGTPVDEYQNPTLAPIRACIDELTPHMGPDTLLVLRSTVYPGVTDWVDRYLRTSSRPVLLAFCPERVVQGESLKELRAFPQLVSGTTERAENAAAELFSRLAPEVVRMRPIEAEFAKLFSNAWRYIQFAVANQFFMMTSAADVDYYRVLEGLKKNYPRAAGIPGAGFAAGPCLFKDTMQLSAFFGNQFGLGHMAMLVNEGLPLFIAEHLLPQAGLEEMTIGLLGMAFKAESDDIRSSLAYKLKKTLGFRVKRVLTTDPYVRDDPELLPLDVVLGESDILILCTPHAPYHHLDIAGKLLVDVWNHVLPTRFTPEAPACNASAATWAQLAPPGHITMVKGNLAPTPAAAG